MLEDAIKALDENGEGRAVVLNNLNAFHRFCNFVCTILTAVVFPGLSFRKVIIFLSLSQFIHSLSNHEIKDALNSQFLQILLHEYRRSPGQYPAVYAVFNFHK